MRPSPRPREGQGLRGLIEQKRQGCRGQKYACWHRSPRNGDRGHYVAGRRGLSKAARRRPRVSSSSGLLVVEGLERQAQAMPEVLAALRLCGLSAQASMPLAELMKVLDAQTARHSGCSGVAGPSRAIPKGEALLAARHRQPDPDGGCAGQRAVVRLCAGHRRIPQDPLVRRHLRARQPRLAKPRAGHREYALALPGLSLNCNRTCASA